MDNLTWIYAYTKLQRRVEEREIPPLYTRNTDKECFDLLADVLCSARMPKGDGKFSRLKNFLESITELALMIKQIWSDENPELTKAISMITVTLECVLNKARIIEKSP